MPIRSETCETDPLARVVANSAGLHEMEAVGPESSGFQPHQHGMEGGNSHPILFVLHLRLADGRCPLLPVPTPRECPDLAPDKTGKTHPGSNDSGQRAMVFCQQYCATAPGSVPGGPG